MSGRAPFVPMRTDLAKDERVAFIADVCGYSRDEVLGKLFRLWAFCTDRKLADAPADSDRYVVHEAVVRRFLGPDGPRALLGDGCDALALGDRRPDGMIALHGTEPAVASLRALYARSHAGGVSRAEQAQRDGRDGGRFVPAVTNTPAGPTAAATDLPDPDPDPDPDPEVDQAPPPRPVSTQGRQGAAAVPAPAPRRPPEPQPAAAPEPTLEQLWTELELARQRAAATRGVSIRPLVAHDSGRADLAAALTEAARVGKRAELVADVRHAIAAAEAESKVVPEAGKRDQLQWFTGAIFRPNNFRRLAGTPVKTVKAKPAAAPATTSERARSAEPRLSAEDQAEIAELARKLGAGRADAAAAEERAAEERARSSVATRPTAELVKMFGQGERAPPAQAPRDDHHDDDHHDDKESA